MGTRGAYGFRIMGEDKLAYNHFDSYPSGLGKSVINEIRGASNEQILYAAHNIIMVNEDVKPTKEQIEECERFSNFNVGGGEVGWYQVLRDAQGDIGIYFLNFQNADKVNVNVDTPTGKEDNTMSLRYMIDSKEFVKDSLFCEYAYILNCDTMHLEVYKGFNKNPNAKGRYAGFKDGEYNGIVLIDERNFDDIRALTDEGVEKYIESLEKLDNE